MKHPMLILSILIVAVVAAFGAAMFDGADGGTPVAQFTWCCEQQHAPDGWSWGGD